MKTIIFEGIATSGKSSLIQQLKAKLASRLDVYVAGEAETHVPIMKESEQLHVGFYKELLNRVIGIGPDLLIFDRLYLTQAFRAKTTLAAYGEIEDELKSLNTTTIFLKVEPSKIEERVQQAINHREAEWGEYVATKGDTPASQAEYYIGQQEYQLKLLSQSKLPYEIYDTTDHNYSRIADEIVSVLGLN